MTYEEKLEFLPDTGPGPGVDGIQNTESVNNRHKEHWQEDMGC